MAHGLGVVHGQTERDVATAVVPCHGEPLVPELLLSIRMSLPMARLEA